MLPHQNFSYGLQSIWNEESLVQKQDSTKRMGMDRDSISRAQKQKSEAAAAKKHAKAEQLRRKRINTHIHTLKKLLLPNVTSKKVKASILTETICQLKELHKRAADVALQQYGHADVSGCFTFPDGSDEATVSRCEGGEGKTVKATVCCEDRPGLNRDLTEAFRSVGGKPVGAEMATIGGRTKAVVVVQWAEGGGEEEEIGLLTRDLKALVESGPLGFYRLGQIGRVNGRTGLGLEMSRNNRAWMYGSFGRTV
ncbi:putative transcription factor bHLH107 [Rhododendron vialii]|uniref:putative transcription factor bHLH107 n=1 Tax=Rhododendron vialii TaxID=182163 RepID=UPI00265E6C75|nr:putative transcription factor bHLH107 [Rhododendron vialii]